VQTRSRDLKAAFEALMEECYWRVPTQTTLAMGGCD
jgi:hypothetical protein